MEIIIPIIIAVLAFATGMVVGIAVSYHRPIGDLRVDRSDPTCEPYLFLELDTDVPAIMRQKSVTLRVKVENFLTHK